MLIIPVTILRVLFFCKFSLDPKYIGNKLAKISIKPEISNRKSITGSSGVDFDSIPFHIIEGEIQE